MDSCWRCPCYYPDDEVCTCHARGSLCYLGKCELELQEEEMVENGENEKGEKK